MKSWQKLMLSTAEQINEVGKTYFQNKSLNLALIGDFNNRQKLEEIVEL